MTNQKSFLINKTMKIQNIKTIEEEIQELSEDDLREKIIIPLMKAFGCSGVRRWCGVLEEGKDVLYRSKNVFNELVDGAIVLKIGKIGKTEWRLVEGQLQEAIKREYESPIFPENVIKIRNLIFITSGKITQFVHSHIRALARDVFPQTEIVDGNRLCDLIELVIENGNRKQGCESSSNYYEFNVSTFSKFCEKCKTITYSREIEENPEKKKINITKSLEGGIIND